MNKRLSSLFIRHSTAGFHAAPAIHMQYTLAYRMRISLVIITCFLLLLQSVSAQELVKADSISISKDSLRKATIYSPEVAKTDSIGIPKHSARKATIYSMVLPGLGQAYNRKYWKIPIIYAGFGTLIYFIHTNNKKYGEFKEAYIWASDPTTTKPVDNPYIEKYNADQLLQGQNYYRRNLEVSIMFTAVLYILNVVDATVDAHLFDFNINDDLSLHMQPYINPSLLATRQNSGLRLTLSF